MRPLKTIPLLLTALTAFATPWTQAKIPVFLQPDAKSALYKEVDFSQLLLPRDAATPEKAQQGWKQAKLAVEQTGFTPQTNVQKELTLKPGSKIYLQASDTSSLIAVTSGKEVTKVIEPGEWTKVLISKPITVYFEKKSIVANATELPPIAPLPPIPQLEKEPEPKVVLANPEPQKQAASPEKQPKAPDNLEDIVEASAVGSEEEHKLNVTVRTQISAAAAPTSTIIEFDNLEKLDPNEVKRSVGPMSSALLEEIRELDPLEVRETAPSQLNPGQLPIDLKPTVSISRDFTGKLIYKKGFSLRPGGPKKEEYSPWQLVDDKDKRIAYVRVEDIKVGNLLNYANKHVILSGPLEENVDGDTPVIQGRTLRLNMKRVENANAVEPAKAQDK